MDYMVSSKDKPQNFPIYDLDTELGYDILLNELTDEAKDEKKAENQQYEFQQSENQQAENQQVSEKKEEGWWSFHFDGLAGR